MSSVNLDASLRSVTAYSDLQALTEAELNRQAAETSLREGSEPTNTMTCNQ